MTPIAQRILQAFWNAVAGAMPRVAILLAGLFVAHRFGPDEYARYSLAFATFALLGTLPGMTLTTVVSKFVPAFDGAASPVRFGTVVRFTITLAIAIGVATWLLAPLLSRTFGVSPPVTPLLQTAAIAAACAIVAGGAAGLLAGAQRFGAAAASYGTGFAVFAAAIVPLSMLLGTAGVLSTLALLYAIAAVTAVRLFGRSLAASRGDRRGAATVWRFYVPMLVAAGLVTPVMWLVNTLLSHGPSALEQLSRFNAAYSWFAVLSFVPAVLAQVEFVEISKMRARGESGEWGAKLGRFVVQNAIVMAPLAAVAAYVAPLLVGFYGLHDAEAARTMRWMAAAALAASLGNPAGLFLSATDRAWMASGLNAGWGAATLVLCWGLRHLGAEGAAIAFLVAYALHCAIAIVLAYRVLSRSR